MRGSLACAIWFWLCVGPALAASNAEELAARRKRVADQLGPQSMLVVFAAEPKNRTGDSDYPYRQDSNFLYLTGLDQPGATLVILPGNSARRDLLFLPERDPSHETWTGHMFSNQEATAISGIEHVHAATAFTDLFDALVAQNPFGLIKYFATPEYQAFLQALEAGTAQVFTVLGGQPFSSAELTREQRFAQRVREKLPGAQVRDALPVLTRLRLIKSAHEIESMQHAIDITVRAQHEAASAAHAGAWEYEIEGLIGYVYRRLNAIAAFPSIVASGLNATTLHYIECKRQMQAGELLLLDIGAEVDGYAADITRTIPVSGKFSSEQRAIYAAVLKAQECGIAATKPGATLADVHAATVESVKRSLLELGLITDAASNEYRMYFMHGTSHYLGLDVHDVGTRTIPLEPGMVITVEPGIYVRSDALDYLPDTQSNRTLRDKIRPAFERYQNIGVRIEDDVLVTERGARVMSEQAPRRIELIEAQAK